jgi:hypothetical protein
MNNQLSIINPKTVDISKPKQFAQLVEQAKTLQNVLQEFWGVAEQQMLDRNVKELSGAWGKIAFEPAKLLTIVDPTLLDPEMTKLALDTKKVHNYEGLFGELPAGTAYKTITKFNKRLKK